MTNAKQTELWQAIQRDAKAAKLSDVDFLQKNPARYAAYKDANAKVSPLHDNPNQRAVSALAHDLAKTKGISESEALVTIFSRDQAGKERYAAWAQERDQRLNPKAHGGAQGSNTGPLTIGEMLQLQREARRLGYDLAIADIEDSGWVAARALIADLAEEAADYADDGDDSNEASESYGEIVRFTDLDRFA